MRNRFLIALFIQFSFFAFSQNSELKLGVKSGVTLSKFTPDLYVGNSRLADYQFKTGFYVGGFSNIKISEKLKLQPELLFSNQGSKVFFENIQMVDFEGNNIGTGNVELKINESTISIPINLQYYISKKFYLESGIHLGYIFSRKEKIIKTTFTQAGTMNNNMKYDKFDFGLNFGLGFSLMENMRINGRTFVGIIERDNSIKPLGINLGIEYEL